MGTRTFLTLGSILGNGQSISQWPVWEQIGHVYCGGGAWPRRVRSVGCWAAATAFETDWMSAARRERRAAATSSSSRPGPGAGLEVVPPVVPPKRPAPKASASVSALASGVGTVGGAAAAVVVEVGGGWVPPTVGAR